MTLPHDAIIFTGCYTRKETWIKQPGDGISTYKFDASDGILSLLGTTSQGTNPMYVQASTKMFSGGNRVLYAVDSVADDSKVNPGTTTGFVSAMDVHSDGTLELLNTLETHGDYPVHISLSPNEDFLVVSNHGGYHSGSVVLYPLNDDGSLAADTFLQTFPTGSSIAPFRQETGHIHSSTWLNSKHLVALDVGNDELHQYELDEANQSLKKLQSARRPPGSGPRHMAVHPNGRFAFVADEIASTVGVHVIDQKTKLLGNRAVQTLSTLPDDYDGISVVADIQITSNGRFLYVTNRGHDSLAIFKVESNGKLKPLGWESSRGERPWSLVIYDKWLVVANGDSSSISVFEIDGDTGKLHFTGNSYCQTATCLRV